MHIPVAGSFGSGDAPSIAPSTIAASATVLAIGPAVSWSAVMGITPYRLIRPTVGLIPASIIAFEGVKMDPEVSVPTFAAHRFAAVPMPELEPPGNSAARASAASRGAPRGTYGIIPKPQMEL